MEEIFDHSHSPSLKISSNNDNFNTNNLLEQPLSNKKIMAICDKVFKHDFSSKEKDQYLANMKKFFDRNLNDNKENINCDFLNLKNKFDYSYNYKGLLTTGQLINNSRNRDISNNHINSNCKILYLIKIRL